MRPLHITIAPESRDLFNRSILPRLLAGKVNPELIQRVSPGPIIVLSDRVMSNGDTKPLIAYFTRNGVPKSHIILVYPSAPTETFEAVLNASLSGGLRGSSLTFGADVAERDAHLERYFVTTGSYQAVLSHTKHIIIGPKGSGKSAILRALSAGAETALVVTPEHYATEVLEAISKMPGNTELAAYITTWKYTLLIEIFRRLVHNRIGETKALSEIRSYLVNHGHLGSDITVFERFLQFLRRITQLKTKIGPAEAEIGVDTVDAIGKFFKMDEVQQLIPALQRTLRRSDFTVYVDELDQSWNNSETANRFLVSLLTAAIQLRGYSDQLHVVAFLRSEVFDLLKPHLPQLDKLRSDIDVIHWRRRELVKLIVSRALDSLQVARDVDADTAIKLLFPRAGRGDGAAGFDHILSRTSMRPREVIQFCNLALDVAKQHDHRAVLPEAVLQAEEVFSSWKLEHIVAENMYIYPGLDHVLEFFRNRPRTLSNPGMDGLLTDVLLHFEDRTDRPPWMPSSWEPIDLLKLLYQLEVIGIEKLEADADPHEHQWESYEFVFMRPKAKPELSRSYLFHPGLWKALELV